ncbi:hypothetical protein [Streptomyces yanii]|uniref:hypothetical protein n=1 Tax=Streptomyces yanii TaxID=78510 RepID=UPI0031F0F817
MSDMDDHGLVTLFLNAEVMPGRGVDQILPRLGSGWVTQRIALLKLTLEREVPRQTPRPGCDPPDTYNPHPSRGGPHGIPAPTTRRPGKVFE